MEKKKITKKYESPFEVAYKYFAVVATLNSIKMWNRELQLLAFIATRGSISTGGMSEEFKLTYGSSYGTIRNVAGKLVKKKFLVKINNKYTINPQLKLDFTNPVFILLELCH